MDDDTVRATRSMPEVERDGADRVPDETPISIDGSPRLDNERDGADRVPDET